jgi:hypothetical protein
LDIRASFLAIFRFRCFPTPSLSIRRHFGRAKAANPFCEPGMNRVAPS